MRKGKRKSIKQQFKEEEGELDEPHSNKELSSGEGLFSSVDGVGVGCCGGGGGGSGVGVSSGAGADVGSGTFASSSSFVVARYPFWAGEVEAAIHSHLQFLVTICDSPLAHLHLSNRLVLAGLVPLVEFGTPRLRRLVLKLLSTAAQYNNTTSSGVIKWLEPAMLADALPLHAKGLASWLLGMIGKVVMAANNSFLFNNKADDAGGTSSVLSSAPVPPPSMVDSDNTGSDGGNDATQHAMELAPTSAKDWVESLDLDEKASDDSILLKAHPTGLGSAHVMIGFAHDVVDFIHALLRNSSFHAALIPTLREGLSRGVRIMQAADCVSSSGGTGLRFREDGEFAHVVSSGIGGTELPNGFGFAQAVALAAAATSAKASKVTREPMSSRAMTSHSNPAEELAATLCVLGAMQPLLRVGGAVEVDTSNRLNTAGSSQLSRAATEAGAPVSRSHPSRVLGTVVDYESGNGNAVVSFGGFNQLHNQQSSAQAAMMMTLMAGGGTGGGGSDTGSGGGSGGGGGGGSDGAGGGGRRRCRTEYNTAFGALRSARAVPVAGCSSLPTAGAADDISASSGSSARSVSGSSKTSGGRNRNRKLAGVGGGPLLLPLCLVQDEELCSLFMRLFKTLKKAVDTVTDGCGGGDDEDNDAEGGGLSLSALSSSLSTNGGWENKNNSQSTAVSSMALAMAWLDRTGPESNVVSQLWVLVLRAFPLLLQGRGAEISSSSDLVDLLYDASLRCVPLPSFVSTRSLEYRSRVLGERLHDAVGPGLRRGHALDGSTSRRH